MTVSPSAPARGGKGPLSVVALALVALVSGAAGVMVGRQVAPAQPAAPSGDLRAVYSRVRPAVVTVRTDLARLDDFESRGSGSGFHVGDGYYVTSAHVVEGGSKFFIDDGVGADGKDQSATLVGQDTVADLALLKARPAKATVTWATEAPQVGEPVFAVGNPFAEAPASLSSGIISGLERLFATSSGTLAGMIQTDAALNPGNSGGPLLDLQGQVVGVNTAILSPSGVFAGIGYAVPAASAREVIKALREGRKVQHPVLGLIGDPEGPPTVSALQPGSLAERAGLRSGDSIRAIAGQRVTSLAEANAVVASRRAGEKVTVLYERDSAARSLDLVLE